MIFSILIISAVLIFCGGCGTLAEDAGPSSSYSNVGIFVPVLPDTFAPETSDDEVKAPFSFPDTVRVLLLNDDGGIFHSETDVDTSKYAGTMDITKTVDGYVYVNEVPLEDYIKGVLPGEMPESFGIEALKAQAVCARTYICSRLPENGYPEYNAIADDSTNFQVYGKRTPTDLTSLAVEETSGQILMKDDYPIDALYFSTSCGFTQTSALFPSVEDRESLKSVYVGNGSPAVTDFDEYFKTVDENAYEKDAKYFRWKIVLDTDGKRKKMIDTVMNLNDPESDDILLSELLAGRIDDSKKNKTSVYDAFGDLEKMRIDRRDEGGVITCLTLIFDKGSVTVNNQLKIRRILGAAVKSATLNDGTSVNNISTLYSGAFTLIPVEGGRYVLYGGGYGHGCGMSQYGAESMASNGFGYDEILSFFYPTAELVKPN